jgi:putative addiction module CopG family antidote
MLSTRSETMADLKLNAKLAKIIQQKVDAGLYDDADDVIESALSLLEAEDRHREWLKREVQIGLDALDRGESIIVDDLDAYFATVRERAAQRRAAGIPIKDAVKP